MNCEKCQELLSDFLEGTLTGGERALLGKHLEACLACADVRSEMLAILDAARECHEHLFAPPNERALWLRISNTIEAEAEARRLAAAREAVALAEARERRRPWERLLDKRWEFSLAQAAAAVAAIAVSVALFTTLGVQRLMSGEGAQQTAQISDPGSRGGAGRQSQIGVGGRNPLDSLERQRVSISYWQQRVEQRKAAWNPRVRDSFDRSLSVIDQQLEDAVLELRDNPHDELSEEMLNSALRDKIELLREFGEQ